MAVAKRTNRSTEEDTMRGFETSKQQDWREFVAVLATCGLIVLTFLAVFIS